MHHGTSRKEVYKRLFGILAYGGQIVQKKENGHFPTLIFPAEIRDVIRRRFPEEPFGKDDEYYDQQPDTYRVSWADMANMKWPNVPKSCGICGKNSKPY